MVIVIVIMEYYSGKQPDLIGPIMKNNFAKITKTKIQSNTISDQISGSLGDFYYSYIQPYLFIIIIIILILVYLFYRYYNKKQKKSLKKNKKNIPERHDEEYFFDNFDNDDFNPDFLFDNPNEIILPKNINSDQSSYSINPIDPINPIDSNNDILYRNF